MAVFNYIVVGAGQAGCRAALTLREADSDATIALIGDEVHPPYERPPLSKGVLKGIVPVQSAVIRQAHQLDDLQIETRFGHAVDRIDVAKKKIVLDDNSSVRFDKLLLATGSRVRLLPVPGVQLAHVHYLRTLNDCLELSQSLANCRHLVVVGAGFIGLEVAASAREQFGCDVTIVEAGADILQRGVPDELRCAIKAQHRANGGRFVFNDGVSAFEGDGKIERLVLNSGMVLEADCAVIGIGVIPETTLAEQAGLDVDDGIVVNEFGETTHPDIFAAGEVTRHQNKFSGKSLRLESWQVAQNQSVVAARTMAGHREAYDEIPWFWTDQFGHNYQLIGATDASLDRVSRTCDGALKSTTFFLKNGDVVGAMSINQGKDIRLVRDAIIRGIDITPEQLADPAIKLKSHLITGEHSGLRQSRTKSGVNK